MDLRMKYYKAAYSQRGDFFDIRVFWGTSRYQNGQGLGDVLSGTMRFVPKITQLFKPITMTNV